MADIVDEKADSPSAEWESIDGKQKHSSGQDPVDETFFEPPKEIALRRDLSARQISMIAVSTQRYLIEWSVTYFRDFSLVAQ